MMEEEGAVIAGLLVGLNVIDANLCMKGEDLDSQVSFFLLNVSNGGQQMKEQSIIFVLLMLFSKVCLLKSEFIYFLQGNEISFTLFIGWSHRFFHVSERWCTQ